jgi:DNA repair protein RadA/Sms
MAKQRVQYVCSSCGAFSAAWAGRCSPCGEWNTISEQLTEQGVANGLASGRILKPEPVETLISHDAKRFVVGLGEADAVLGGGIVAGSVNLIAGQPGIGKSTLLLQVADSLANQYRVLYVSGEESGYQIGLRAKRLGVSSDNLKLATSTDADDIAATIASGKYDIVIVDSIQTLATQGIASSAGTVSQITNSAHLIVSAAKKTTTAVILVGHVTKEGSIAGPKVLEHVVDVVLQLEGDSYGGFKILRANKNRFGPTTEVGIFEMVESGMRAVENPSAALLSERQASDGSIVLATLEGTRPILVEIQALVNKTSYGYPKRAASGIDLNRVNLLIAVLEKRTKLSLADQDVYINVVGGVRLSDPAADLAVCMAIGSAAKGLQLRANAVVFGEVGLSGEIRHVPYADKRLAEAKKLGFEAAIGPKQRQGKQPAFMINVPDVRQALNQFLEKE